MANIAPPTQKKKKVAKTVVHLNPKTATGQIPPDAIKPLQLKIPESAKNEFKAYAAMHSKSMAAMFLEMFEEHKQTHS